ncbi:MAG TPA: type II toxin-antitoxin system VapC family toxin [Longimicrobium sp.]
MDRPTVYIETSIVSYLASRPSRDPVTLRNQQLTHAWWNTRRPDYALFTSKFVIDEAADGDPVIAQRRVTLLTSIPLLASEGTVAEELAQALVRGVPLPPRAFADAMHIALASVRGMAYLLTWNCKHIANPRLQTRMARITAAWGFTIPALRTPAEL